MDEEMEIAGNITRVDVVDALSDLENSDALTLLTQYYKELSGKGASIDKRIKNATVCTRLLLDAKRYEDVNVWLDDIATGISDKEGPDSEAYMAFTENEDLEEMRILAGDKSTGEEEEEDFEVDDDE